MKAVKTRQAVIDIIETADYIAQDNLEVAIRFIEAVEATIEKLTATPKIGKLQTIKSQHNLRMWFVDGFSDCLIFYTVTHEEIEIIRMIHSSRDYFRVFDNG